jgi:hypothetical protein
VLSKKMEARGGTACGTRSGERNDSLDALDHKPDR